MRVGMTRFYQTSTQPRLTLAKLRESVDILADRDPDIRRIRDTVGYPPLWARRPGFSTLVHIILEQQVSLASAKAAFDRLVAYTDPLTPESLLPISGARMKRIGFSRQKTRYARILAEAILSGELDCKSLNRLDDDAVRDELMKLTGIGRWTADIYLIMILLRPDIWPLGDIALANAMRKVKGLKARPENDRQLEIAEQWRPHRAVAARCFWHYYLSGELKR
jgi:DNA-3-methyladenine glycosylase II